MTARLGTLVSSFAVHQLDILGLQFKLLAIVSLSPSYLHAFERNHAATPSSCLLSVMPGLRLFLTILLVAITATAAFSQALHDDQHHLHLHRDSTSPQSSEQCPQHPALTPHKRNAALYARLVYTRGESFRERAVRALGGAVRIPCVVSKHTESR